MLSSTRSARLVCCPGQVFQVTPGTGEDAVGTPWAIATSQLSTAIFGRVVTSISVRLAPEYVSG